MWNVEKRVLEWLEAHLSLFAVLAFAAAGVAVRLPLMNFASGDYQFFLLPWYEEIREQGLEVQVGNYNLLYQQLIFWMTRLPLEPMQAYKLLSIVFDYLLAIAAAGITWRIASEDRLWKSIFAFGAVLLSPTVFLNSAAWAQCDSIYVFFCVAALVAMLRERYRMAMIFMGVAFSFKLQAVFMLPLMLFTYFRKKKFSILEFLWIPAVMCLTGIPAMFFGRNPLEIFTIYNEQAETYPYMSMNYPSAWLLLTSEMDVQQYKLMYKPAMLMTVCVLAVYMLAWIRAKVTATGKNLLYMAFLTAYTCVLLLPCMHDRYGYLYEVLAVVIACMCPSTIPLCTGLLGISLCTYGAYLFKIETISLVWLAVINLAIYVGYAVLLGKRMAVEKTE